MLKRRCVLSDLIADDSRKASGGLVYVLSSTKRAILACASSVLIALFEVRDGCAGIVALASDQGVRLDPVEP